MDIPEQTAKERVMGGNTQRGEWEEDTPAKLSAPKEEGSNRDLLGFDDRDFRTVLDRMAFSKALEITKS